MNGAIVGALIVPTMPHPLLVPGQNPHYQQIREAYEEARRRIHALGADTLILYSTRWPSVIGHQIQADPEPVWTHVDEEFHDLGSIPYHLRIDAELAESYAAAARRRGLAARTVAYTGFPIDTGSVVALKLLDPDRRLGATTTSCNMYADRAETLVLGKAAADAVRETGRRAVAVAVTQLSNRQHARPVPWSEDRFSSLKDDEWNRKILEFLGEGRLEDVSQLARTFTAQANGDSRLRAIWWLAAAAGPNNAYAGDVLAYGPVAGAGCAVVWLTPGAKSGANLEFDEEDVERYRGDRGVLAGEGGTPGPEPAGDPEDDAPPPAVVRTETAPRPVGPYPHARREGPFLFLSGMGPRQPGTDAIPGGPIRGPDGAPLPYDVRAQTRAVIENIRAVLHAAGASLEHVVDVTCFLVDMDRDFSNFNDVYREYFQNIGPTRTTVAVSALPTPIAVELKVIARIPESA